MKDLVLKTKLLFEAGRFFLDGGFRIFLERGVQSLGVGRRHLGGGAAPAACCMQRALTLLQSEIGVARAEGSRGELSGRVVEGILARPR